MSPLADIPNFGAALLLGAIMLLIEILRNTVFAAAARGFKQEDREAVTQLALAVRALADDVVVQRSYRKESMERIRENYQLQQDLARQFTTSLSAVATSNTGIATAMHGFSTMIGELVRVNRDLTDLIRDRISREGHQ